MPEAKTAKNRVHLDVRVAGLKVVGEERKRLVSEKVERLAQAGASIAWVSDTFRDTLITMRDPEGNAPRAGRRHPAEKPSGPAGLAGRDRLKPETGG